MSAARRRPTSSTAWQLLGVPFGVALGLFVYLHQHSDFGLVIIVLVPVFVGINIAAITRSRRRLANPSARNDQLTGVLLAPQQLPSGGSTSSATRWTGAADMVGGMGRINASTPLGVLELKGQTLSLRVRPQVMARIFGVLPLSVIPEGVEAVYPSLGRLRYKAIAIRPLGQPASYFLTVGGNREAMLTAIAAAGFPVQWAERRYSFT